MTQIAALGADSQSTGKKGFRLEIYNRLGTRHIITYTSESPGGLIDGFASRRYASGVCGDMTFQAKPNGVRIEAGSVLRLSFDTGTSVVPVHYGTVITNPDGRSGELGTFESAGGKELLKASKCDENAFYRYADGAGELGVILRLLVRTYKHSALKYDASKIPNLGVETSGVDARGRNLDEVIAKILEAVPTITENDWGVDADGYVVIRPPNGVLNVLKSSVTTEYGDITSDGTVTEATILVANEVSSGAVVSAGYRPGLVSYTFTHPEHADWGRPRSFEIEKDSEGRAVLDLLSYTPRAGFGYQSGWLASTTNGFTEVSLVLQDGNLDTYAYAETTKPFGYLRLGASLSGGFVGVAMALDAPAGSYNMGLTITYETADPAGVVPNVVKHTVKFDLNHLKAQGKVEARFTAPLPTDTTVNAVQAEFWPTGTVPSGFKVYEFRGLAPNLTLLDQIARAQIRLPAREVQEVTFKGGYNIATKERYSASIIEKPVKTIRFLGDRGEDLGLSGDIAVIEDTANRQEGMYSRVSLGQSVRDPMVRAILKAAGK